MENVLNYLSNWSSQIDQNAIVNVASALGILLLGYVAAVVARYVVTRVCRKASLDTRIGGAMTDGQNSAVPVSRWAGTLTFWGTLLFAASVFFERVDLPQAAAPIGALFDQVFAYVPRLLGALAIMGIALVIARVVRSALSGALKGMDLENRFSTDTTTTQQTTTTSRAFETPRVARAATAASAGTTNNTTFRSTTTSVAPSTTSTTDTTSVSTAVAETAHWLVLLLAIPMALGVLGIEGLLAPMQSMFDKVLSYLPNIAAAAATFAIGWFVAKIVQQVVTNLVASAGGDRLGTKLGIEPSAGRRPLSQITGTIARVLIIIPVAIAALDALGINSITEPASAMLGSVFAALPAIFGAVLILGFSYVVGKLVSELATGVLETVGFDQLFVKLGMKSSVTEGRRPSAIAGSLALVAIMLFAGTAAANKLGFPTLAANISDFVALGGRVLLGLTIIGIGLYLGNLVADTIKSSQVANANVLSTIARIATIVLAGAMGLRQMGLANEIITLAFGLTLGSAAIASAIAFGIGGRDHAARLLEAWTNRLESYDGSVTPRQTGMIPKAPGVPTDKTGTQNS